MKERAGVDVRQAPLQVLQSESSSRVEDGCSGFMECVLDVQVDGIRAGEIEVEDVRCEERDLAVVGVAKEPALFVPTDVDEGGAEVAGSDVRGFISVEHQFPDVGTH